MTDRTDSKVRLLLLFLVVTLLAGGLSFRLVYWQVNQKEELAALVNRDTTSQLTIPAKRGTIYDRTGTVVLAETIDKYRIVANLHDLDKADRQRYGDLLTDYLELNADQSSAMRKTLEGTGYYVILARNVDADVARQLEEQQSFGELSQVTLEVTPVRVYPQAG